VFSSVSFIGYQINGFSGLIISTIAIFLPFFLLVGLIQPILKWVGKNRIFKLFLEGLNIAFIALIVAVTLKMVQNILVDWKAIFIFFYHFIYCFSIQKNQ